MPTTPPSSPPATCRRGSGRIWRRTGQPVPEDDAALVRCVLDSLALGYRRTVEDLAAVTGRPVTAVGIVGGGSRNQLLNQAVGDVTGLPVVAGPVEATALGNIRVQLIALGDIRDLPGTRGGPGRSRPGDPPGRAVRLRSAGRALAGSRELVAADRVEVGVGIKGEGGGMTVRRTDIAGSGPELAPRPIAG